MFLVFAGKCFDFLLILQWNWGILNYKRWLCCYDLRLTFGVLKLV